MNPYRIAEKIRMAETTLNNFTYEAFDKVAPEVRLSLNVVLDSLKKLAYEIEFQADEEFSNEKF